MSGAQKRAPEVRFKGFTDDWEQRQLGDEVEIIGTGNSKYKTNTEKSDETPYKVLGSTGIIGYDSNFDYSGDFILTARVGANAGTLYTHSGNVKISDNTVFIKSYSLNFTYYLLMQFDLKKLSFGTGQPLVKASELKALKLMFPKSNTEQIYIGDLLMKIDELINLHQRKLDLLKQLKQAYLQVLFPIEGEKSPRVRFTNFVADWEQRKLGEVADFFDEKRIPIDSGKRNVGEYPYYGATGIIDYVDGYIFDGEYVLLAEDGANIIMRNSPIAYLTEGKFWLNNHAHIMRLKDGSNNFLIQLLEKQNYNKYNSGTAQPKLNGQVIKKIILSFPNKDEQKKIGSFFNTLDDFIALHQKKITTITKLKSLYLQKMFC